MKKFVTFIITFVVFMSVMVPAAHADFAIKNGEEVNNEATGIEIYAVYTIWFENDSFDEEDILSYEIAVKTHDTFGKIWYFNIVAYGDNSDEIISQTAAFIFDESRIGTDSGDFVESEAAALLFFEETTMSLEYYMSLQ